MGHGPDTQSRPLRLREMEGAEAVRWPLLARHPEPLLSPRLARIVEYAADGHSNREIATKLSYSPRTIDGLIDQARRSLQARNRPHLVSRAITQGIIEPVDTRRVGAMTLRQLEVATCLAGGLTAEQIATALEIAPRTVTTHVDKAKRATRCNTSTQLAALATSWCVGRVVT